MECVMQFNGIQLAAILKAAQLMSIADGKTEKSEVEFIASEFNSFNVDKDQFAAILKAAEVMEAEDMVKALSSLDSSQKKYVCGFLAVIILSDGDVDESEVKMWQLLCTMCKFPTMTVKDAMAYYANN